MINHAPRITRHFKDISGALQDWSDRSQVFIVSEHDPDEGCKKTHVHLGIWNCEVKDEALKRMFNSKTGLQLSGNKDWAWVHEEFKKGLPDWEDIEIDPILGLPRLDTEAKKQNFKYLRYLIKGDLSRIFLVKNISTALLEAASNSWVSWKQQSPMNVTVIEKRVKPPPYQQTVIADAAADWMNYKRECNENGTIVEKDYVAELICKHMRLQGRGINEYLVKDLAYAVLYDDLDFRGLILRRVRMKLFS